MDFLPGGLKAPRECSWQPSERFPPCLIFASINQQLRLLWTCSQTWARTHKHSCTQMNSNHWCFFLWGLLPVWGAVLSRYVVVGKPIHQGSPALPPHTQMPLVLFTPSMFSHVSLLPGPLHYLPAHSCPRPCQSFLCLHSLLLCFFCHFVFITLFVDSSLPVFPRVSCVVHGSPASLQTKRDSQSGQ